MVRITWYIPININCLEGVGWIANCLLETYPAAKCHSIIHSSDLCLNFICISRLLGGCCCASDLSSIHFMARPRCVFRFVKCSCLFLDGSNETVLSIAAISPYCKIHFCYSPFRFIALITLLRTICYLSLALMNSFLFLKQPTLNLVTSQKHSSLMSSSPVSVPAET